MLPYRPIELPYKEIPGVVSRRALQDHYSLYLGYVDKINAADTAQCRLPEGGAEAFLRQQSYAWNGMLLHELYFVGLTDAPTGSDQAPETGNALCLQWGSVGSWWTEMIRAGMASRGWAVLVKDWHGHLRILGLQDHETGALFGQTVICAVDAYEHAYWMDFGADKSRYLDALFSALDWRIMEQRFQR